MSGVTLHIYQHEIKDIISMWNLQLKSIQGLLPKDYTENDIVGLLKLFYPHEWYSVEIKYWYYTKKDKHIKRHYGKARYNMKPPEKLLYSSRKYRELLSIDCRNKYAANYSEKKTNELKVKLWDKRKAKIEQINQKIEIAKSKTQQVTPSFIHQLTGLYERKNTSHNHSGFYRYEA